MTLLLWLSLLPACAPSGDDLDGDGLIGEEDCNDADASVGGTTFYADTDGDGYGDAEAPLVRCEQPDGYVLDASDCDDANLHLHPAADEVCDAIDNDCDGLVDDDDEVSDDDIGTWSADDDGDGYGDLSGTTVTACEAPDGFGPVSDCDDTSATVHPDQDELCDGVDSDCDGLVLDQGTVTFFDDDGDPTDLTAVFGAGTEDAPYLWESSAPGELRLCEGDFAAQLTISHDVLVEGAPAGGTVIDAHALAATLRVAADDPVSVEVHDLMLTGGLSEHGGCVSVEGSTLTLQGVELFSCEATDAGGGLYAEDASVYLQEVWVRDNVAPRGGGLALFQSELSLDSASISYNQAEDGGGLFLDDTPLTASSAQAHDNEADESGGGVYLTGSDEVVIEGLLLSDNTAGVTGGGLYSDAAVALTLSAMSFRGNSCDDDGYGGGLSVIAETVALTDTELSDNSCTYGGALAAIGSAVTLGTDVRLQDNDAEDGGGIWLDGGSLVAEGTTFTGNQATWSGGGLYLASSDVSLTSVSLSDNTARDGAALYASGELTLEISEAEVSDNYAAAAIEVEGGTTTLTKTTFSGSSNSGDTADFVQTGGSVTVEAVTSSTGLGTYGFSFEELDALAVEGLTVNASELEYAVQVFQIDAPELDELTVTGGGGCLATSHVTDLSWHDSACEGSTAGFASYLFSTDGTLEQLTFSDNASQYTALYAYSSELSLVDVTFDGNATGVGALSGSRNSLLLDGVVFTDNSASGRGAAVYLDWSDLTWQDDQATQGSLVSNNSSLQSGGGVYLDRLQDTSAITGVTFEDNTAGEDGGALVVVDGDDSLAIDACTFSGNKATLTGGALYIAASDVTSDGSSFSQNEATWGGAIGIGYLEEDQEVSLDQASFTSNSPEDLVHEEADESHDDPTDTTCTSEGCASPI